MPVGDNYADRGFLYPCEILIFGNFLIESMNRNLYFFGIIFLGLSIILTFFQSLIQFQVGNRIFSLPSFIPWFILVILVSLIWTIILLKYYHFKKYRSAFILGIITTGAALCFYFLVYLMLKGNRPGTYNALIFLAFLGTGILYSLSLIFSGAGKRPWLKAAGVFGLMIDLALIAVMIWSMILIDVQSYVAIGKLNQWISLAGALLPVLYLFNFLSEIKQLKVENRNPSVLISRLRQLKTWFTL